MHFRLLVVTSRCLRRGYKTEDLLLNLAVHRRLLRCYSFIGANCQHFATDFAKGLGALTRTLTAHGMLPADF